MLISDSYNKMRTSVWPIRIPYAPPHEIHENTLFSKIAENSVFHCYTVLGHYQGTMDNFLRGSPSLVNPSFCYYSALR